MFCCGCNLGVALLLGFGNLEGATLKYGRPAQPQRSVGPMKRSLMFTLPRLRANLEPPYIVTYSPTKVFIYISMEGCVLTLSCKSCVFDKTDNDDNGDV